jgi:hypothetical protein
VVLNGTKFHDKEPARVARVGLPGENDGEFDASYHGCRRARGGVVRLAGLGPARSSQFCLKTGSAQECAYDSFAQCEAAKRGGADSCVQNSPPQNH